MDSTLLVILSIVLTVIIVYVIMLYNSIVKAKIRVEETWKQIDVRLQNRYDLLPDLIQAVEKAVSTDESIQTKIAEVRSAVNTAKSVVSSPEHAADIAKVENSLVSALSGLRVSVESYPELKSQQAIQDFMNRNTIIEEKIAAARQIYNSTAREYNEKIAVVPNNIIAGLFNFKPVTYYEISEEARRDISPDWGGKSITR
ncbi:MAG: LemA family protein [Spirochaetota bacterium]